jgi:hypothetical protein
MTPTGEAASASTVVIVAALFTPSTTTIWCTTITEAARGTPRLHHTPVATNEASPERRDAKESRAGTRFPRKVLFIIIKKLPFPQGALNDFSKRLEGPPALGGSSHVTPAHPRPPFSLAQRASYPPLARVSLSSVLAVHRAPHYYQQLASLGTTLLLLAPPLTTTTTTYDPTGTTAAFFCCFDYSPAAAAAASSQPLFSSSPSNAKKESTGGGDG